MEFSRFAEQVQKRFVVLSKHELFTTISDGDAVYQHYLASFPEGTNPVYRERTEHDCGCCKNFIRNLGNVVAIIDGKAKSVWSGLTLDYPYNVVAERLAELVESHTITSLYRTKEAQYGAQRTREALVDGGVKVWTHLHGEIANQHKCTSPAKDQGAFNTAVAVFKRGLEELSPSAFSTVLDLIDEKSLYRGEEFRPALADFQKTQKNYLELTDPVARDIFVWANAAKPVARFRNTAMGSLIQGLSEGMDLEAAVRSFEAMVAPTNYKRTTALITPAMVKQAMGAIGELGLESALERRFARLGDVSVNNVLWVDNSVQSKMKDGIESLLMSAATTKPVTAKQMDQAETIGIEDFMTSVLPKAKGMELLFKYNLQSNLMSLTAPVHADVAQLFKWDNNFAWSYNGNITDSIKEKVKRAGGNTNTPLRVSLAWFNPDDLDIHCSSPQGHICFRNKGGILDVDMNAYGEHSDTEPVENLAWEYPKDGEYIIWVNQYNRRSSERPGFVIELENNGTVSQFSYPFPVKGDVQALHFVLKNGIVTKLHVAPELTNSGIQKEFWGITTEKFIKVETMMFSPNHWDDQKVGNKHWFFFLEGCRNPEAARGIYNEFLRSDLDQHRKVFEVLGAKTKCEPTDDQLSGLGFSSTRGDSVLVRVTGDKTNKLYNLKF